MGECEAEEHEIHGEVKDLQVDFKDGLALIALLEALTSAGKIENYVKSPKIKAQMIDNLGTCFSLADQF